MALRDARLPVVAMATAAVIGIAGGVYAATSTSGTSSHGPAASPSSSGPSPSTVPSSPSSAQPLLYATPTQIHDGARTVHYPGLRGVRDLYRINGGYLLLRWTDPQEPAFEAWVVTDAGETAQVASVVGNADVDDSGELLVGVDTHDYRLKIWNAAHGGEVMQTWKPPSGQPAGSAAFVGTDVYLTVQHGRRSDVVRWDTITGRSEVVARGMWNLSVSPDGKLLAGSVLAQPDAPYPTCLGVRPVAEDGKVAWKDCDWQLWKRSGTRFSPDGSRVLAIPAQTEGFGPTRYGVFESATGGTPAVVDAPDLATAVEWADESHLYVHSTHTLDGDGTTIRRCDLDGACMKLVTTDDAAVLGHTS